jgi:23S rRNA (uracil1939-C5)-methyltransferase
VADALDRIGQVSHPDLLPILPSGNTRYYRNRLDFAFSAEGWVTRDSSGELPAERAPALGYHLPRKYDKVFDVEECFLQAAPSNAIRQHIRRKAIDLGIPFFDLRKQVGFLRTLTIRTASTGEVMVILQVTYDRPEWTRPLFDDLTQNFPQITSLNYVINGKANDTFQDLEVICAAGSPYIMEQMTDSLGRTLRFRVGPKSFYQTNSGQARVLYERAGEFAQLSGKERVYDLYTGAGTIASFVAGKAQEVIGLEYVEAAVQDARVNSEINGITNTKFFAGDLKDLLTPAFFAEHGAPDVVITDPPRAGMHDDVCRMLLLARPERIVYVSCNPATQARDLKTLSEHYEITAVQPVDMFPHTVHVENIVQLKKS